MKQTAVVIWGGSMTVHSLRAVPHAGIGGRPFWCHRLHAQPQELSTVQSACEEAVRFQSEAPQIKNDSWGLVDGQVRFKCVGQAVHADILEITARIRPADRFLTLVCTHGGMTANYDWAAFGRPSLEVVEVHWL